MLFEPRFEGVPHGAEFSEDDTKPLVSGSPDFKLEGFQDVQAEEGRLQQASTVINPSGEKQIAEKMKDPAQKTEVGMSEAEYAQFTQVVDRLSEKQAIPLGSNDKEFNPTGYENTAEDPKIDEVALPDDGQDNVAPFPQPVEPRVDEADIPEEIAA